MRDESIRHILDELPQVKERVAELKEVLLANLVMVGEIPSPTFGEQRRVRFLRDRFTEGGLQNCSTDEVDNAFGILPGRKGERNILIVAHTDTVVPETVDHTVTVDTTHVSGPGIGDNSLGVATLATLPTIFEKLELEFDSTLVFMGSSRSLGRGNLEGLRFFLENKKIPIDAAICVEGMQLGRLSHISIGMLRAEIRCTVPEEYDWSRFEAEGAITSLNEVINRMMEIPLPKRPRTSIVLGEIAGGHSFSSIAAHASLKFEIRSEADEMVESIREQIEEILAEASSRTAARYELDVVAHRRPGGISFSHPLPKSARKIMDALGVEPIITPSTSELAALIDHEVPAVTIGITRGENIGEQSERVEIEPMFTGITQLIGLLKAIDGGLDHEDR